MQTNLKEYDTYPSWVPPQNQPYEGRYIATPGGQQQLLRPQNSGQVQRPTAQKPKTPEKMPKARALALANRLKRGLAIASIVGFGAFGGLVALHQVGTSSSSSTQSTQTSSGSSSTKSSSSSSSSSQNSSNFLNQQGGNTGGTSSSSTNSNSTSSSSNSSSSTVTGTHSS